MYNPSEEVIMARYKSYSYQQTKLIPLSLEKQIVEGTFEHALNYIVDHKIDLSVFDSKYKNDKTGAPAWDPAIMLKIVLFAYSKGIMRSRKISKACDENIIFMALSGDSHPHYTTIAYFISSMKDQIVPIFRDVLSLCYSQGLIGKEMFAIDGCKISSNCSKEWSGTRADLKKKRNKLEKSIKFLLGKHKMNDDKEKDGKTIEQKKKAVESMQERIEKISTWLNENPKDKMTTRNKPMQSNITDNESSKMPTSHGVIQGYTGVAAVDDKNQVIVHAEAHGVNQEKSLLKPTIDGVRDNFRKMDISDDVLKEATLLADTGYHSNENIEMVMEEGIDAVIADGKFRKRDPRLAEGARHRKSTDRNKARYERKRFHNEDFKLDKEKNVLICPAGKELKHREKQHKSSSGLIGPLYKAKDKDCMGCAYTKKCLGGKNGRTVILYKYRAKNAPESYTQKMIKIFDSARGRHLYSRRMGIVEPVYGNIRNTIGLDRFSLRGKIKVDIQWKLYAIVHNIGKIFRYGPSFA
jgi:transposase